MPCSGGNGSGGDWDDYRGPDQDAQRKIGEMKAQLDVVTALLCAICQKVDKSLLTPEMNEWYRQHRLYDLSQGRGP